MEAGEKERKEIEWPNEEEDEEEALLPPPSPSFPFPATP